MVANALVSSRLAYCNSLFRNLSPKNITTLQNIQIFWYGLFLVLPGLLISLQPYPSNLHWLPVKQRIIFKALVLILVPDCWQAKAFCSVSAMYTSVVKTRCSNPENMFFKVPFYSSPVHKSKAYFNKCLSYEAPKRWNDLPLEIRIAPALLCSKGDFKPICFRSLSLHSFSTYQILMVPLVIT